MARRCTQVITAVLALCALGATQPSSFVITPSIQEALDKISPDSLRGNLSFLASDSLAGRDTPSPGLDIAAEFIAAEFRKTGIEPVGGDGYFQTAEMALQTPDLTGFSLIFADGDKTVPIAAQQASIRANAAVDLTSTPIFKLDLADTGLLEKLTPADLDGKAVLMEINRGAMQGARSAMSKIRTAKPAVLITIDRKASEETGVPTPLLFDPHGAGPAPAPRLSASGEALGRFYDGLKPGASSTAAVSIHLAAPKSTPVRLRNVAGILRGSDPALKDTYVLVSAHYDHIGQKKSGDGDRIYNGANDDGSGTVSVVEIARALATLKRHPKRSIVFLAFFGEEKGLLGSRYYARHPLVPLAATIADINLEQVGRTDSTEGAQLATTSLTGFDYSDLPKTMQAAGALTGIQLTQHPRNSDLYFMASDNLSLAEAGVPAHSLTVAFNYPDYHGLGDEWQKIDYDNMAKVDRMVGLALLMLAETSQPPQWNAANPKAESYLKAWNDTHKK